jgi:GT2 family glycosyltransferase
VIVERNQGFTGGCNAGFAHARGELVGILANDNRPEPTWLEQLVLALDRHPEAAAAMSRSPEPGDPGPCVCGSLNPLGYNVILSTDWPPDRRPVPIFYASGNALLCRRALITRFFDPLYFMYSEDVSLGWLLRLKGWNVLYAPSSVTHHAGGATTSRTPGRRAFFQTRNRYLNLLLHYERGSLLRLLPWMLFDALATVVVRGHRAARLGALAWLANHAREVLARRRELQAQRRSPDRDLWPYFAPRGRLLRLYLSALGIRGLGSAVLPR